MAVNSITNSEAYAKVTGTSGKDSIVTGGSYTTVLAGDGDDTISNENGGTSRILGEGGNDSIYNGENSGTSTIDGGAGDDYIKNYRANSVKIIGGDGNDYIDNIRYADNAQYVTVTAGAGNDTIYNSAYWAVLSGGAGDDSIKMDSGANSKAIGGEGNDKIISNAYYNTIDGGVDNDLITNSGAYSSINAGTGNDFVTNSAEVVSIESSAGNNEIQNTGTYARIYMGTGSDSIFNHDSATNSIIDSGDGNDFIENAASTTSINGGAGDDSIANSGSSVLISGGDGNDTIDNGAYYANVSNVSIEASAGNDLIILGDEAKNNLIHYTDGDGKDLVTGFKANDTLQIGDGEDDTYATVKSGSNLIITVGKGNITLQGAADLESVNILGKLGTGSGDTTPPDTQSGGNDTQSGGNDTPGGGNDTPGGGNDTPSGGNDTPGGGNDTEGKIYTNTTKKASLTGTAYEDEFYNRANSVTMKGGDSGDLLISLKKTSSVKMYGESGDDTLESYNGTKIYLYGGADNDEIYISGSTSVTAVGGAGDDSIEIENSSNVLVSVSASGDGNDLISGFNENSKLKIGNGTTDTYKAEVKGEDVIFTVGESQITVSNAASWLKFDDKDAHPNILGTFQDKVVVFDDKSKTPATVAAGIEIADATSRTKAIKIIGNELDNSIIGGTGKDTIYGGDTITASNDTLEGGKGDDKIYGRLGDDYLYGGAGNDYLSGGEGEDTLWGGSGNDTLAGGSEADVFIYSGGKDVITDYVSGEDFISLGAAYSKSSIKGNDVVLTVGKGTLTIKNAKYKEVTFIDGEDIYTKRLGVEEYDNDSPANVSISAGVEFGDATGRDTAIKIFGNELNNTILGGSGKDTLYGANGTDSLFGGKGNDKLFGDEGEDTLWGGAGNDTLTGGEDDDLFIYSGGKDVIADYVSGEDRISLGSAYTKASVSGDDVILTIKTNNTLRIKNAKYEEITFVDANGDETTEFFGGVKFTNSSNANQTLAAEVEFANATSRTKAIKIVGNDLNNTILGGTGKDKLYGEDGDDYLVGGKGNDSLWGGDGSDTFVYSNGDGTDKIYDFEDDDMLQITGDWTGSYNVGTNTVAIKVGSTASAITLEDFTANTFNINGDQYKISGSKLVKK